MRLRIILNTTLALGVAASASADDASVSPIPAVGKRATKSELLVPVSDLPAPPKLQLDYNFAASELPTASVLSVTSKPETKSELAEPAKVEVASKPTETPSEETKKVEPEIPQLLKQMSATKAPMPMEKPVSYDPARERMRWYRDCTTHVQVLAGSPMESDRQKALHALAATPNWQAYAPAYAVLRQVALMEYNIKMRSMAVEMLATARGEHHLVADTLKMSALYDSNADIRTKATAMLYRLASAAPDSFVR